MASRRRLGNHVPMNQEQRRQRLGMLFVAGAAILFASKGLFAKALYQRIVNVVANPRPFIKTKTFFGPDRRRGVNPNYIGPERRKGNKAEVIRKMHVLLESGLKKQKRRIATKPTAAAKERRIEEKKRQSRAKEGRKKMRGEE